MKKILLSLITIASISMGNAQIKEKGTYEITPKIGVSNFSEYNEGESTEGIIGVAFGATADYYLNNRWSLRSGLMYNTMGGEYNMDLIGSNAKINFEDKLNYLNIPINANWHFGSTRKWNLNFGLTPSFLLSAKVNDETIPDDIIEPFQLGLNFGIGYKIEVNKKLGILIDYQAFIGLTNIDKTNYSNITNIGDAFSIGAVLEL